jgi:putative hydrolase of the HAD superfamily
MPIFDFIAFDADDTLWHNERNYARAQAGFAHLLGQYHGAEWISARLYETESRNIQHYGYGVKAFALSMLETAVELTEGRISGADVKAIIGLARELLSADVELLEQVRQTIPRLASSYRLMVITKGDLLDQETKMARSGLAEYFQSIEVVSHKNRQSYARILERCGVAPGRFLMVGNSLKSDILPVLELGAAAVHIPYDLTWLHEQAEPPPPDQPGFYSLEHIGRLPDLLDGLERERR